ncbi:MAG: hypothetical protein LBF12_07025 [Christensenellaceae bacterium]|jgi:hypothetical protein|nr:hypothetical protein [Christensenellaceae bacterium]
MSKKRVIEERVIEQIEPTTLGLFFGSLFRLIFVSLKILFFILIKICKFFGLWLPIIYVLFGLILHFTTGFNPFVSDFYSDLYISGFSLCLVFVIILTGRNLFFRPFRGVSSGFANPIWQRARSNNSNPLPQDELKNENQQETTASNMPLNGSNYYFGQSYAEPYPTQPMANNYPQNQQVQNMPTQPMAYPMNNPGQPYSQNFVQSNQNYMNSNPMYASPPLYQRSYNNPTPNPNQTLQNSQTANSRLGLSPFAMAISKPDVAEMEMPLVPNNQVSQSETPKVYFSKRDTTLLVHEYKDRFETFRIKNGQPVKERVEYK